VRHLIFDFFGTLVNYEEIVGAHRIELARTELSNYGVDLDADAIAARFSDSTAALERLAQATLEEFSMADAARAFFADLGVGATDVLVERFVDAFLADWTGAVVPLPRLREWLAALPLPKSVLSNTHHEPMVLGLLDRFDLRHAFGRITTSIGHGYRKPHASVYRAHLDAVGVAARDAVFVGDNPQCDYFGPRAVGIEAYLIAPRPVAGVPERFRLGHLYQLMERLGG
jgi:putative hydrolase of the HAD superfamily